MSEKYKLQKWVWNETDFEQMGWHDCQIHAFAFLPDQLEFVLDIDYILQWVHPIAPHKYFKFWVAPTTLVFENVQNLVFDLKTEGGLQIIDLKREQVQSPHNTDHINGKQEWRWVFDCQEGNISFRSGGFKQYIRSTPQLIETQVLDVSVRGDFSFVRGRID